MDRVCQRSAGTYPFTIATTDDAGTAVVPETPASVTIKDGAGTAVFTDATPTVPGTPGEGETAATAMSTVVPVANLAQLDTYLLSWSATVTVDDTPTTITGELYFELCGGNLFEIADLRASDPAFLSATNYPDAKIRTARLTAERLFEKRARLAYVPRGRRLSLLGSGTYRLELPDNALRTVVSASIDGTALTAGELSALVVREWGALDRPEGYVWTKDAPVEVFYTHGEDRPPEPVSEAVMIVAREFLVRSALSSRATVEATDVGFYRLSVAGPDKFGIPYVDSVLAEYGRRRPRVG